MKYLSYLLLVSLAETAIAVLMWQEPPQDWQKIITTTAAGFSWGATAVVGMVVALSSAEPE